MAKSSVGQKRAEARRRNRELRDLVTGMTNQQLINFLKGFDMDTLNRLEKAFGKVQDLQRQQQLEAIDSEIEALTAKRENLAAGK